MSLVDEARTVRQRIADRLAELEPLAREYEELKQLAAEMGVEQLPAATSGTRAAPSSASPSRPGSGSSSRSASTSASASRRSGRPRRAPASRDKRENAAAGPQSNELTQRVIEAVRSEPGKTVAEYAAALQVAPTALYRPVRQLTTSGDVVKRSRQLFPG